MERELRDAIRTCAIEFTSTRSPVHETPDGRPVASRLATWDEIQRLVGVMGELNAGIFELAGEAVGREAPDSAAFRDYHVRLRDLAVETGRPITFGNFSRLEAREVWPHYMALLDETAAAGGRMFAQVHSRGLNVMLSFKTQLPFDNLPAWKPFRALPLDEQKRQLRDPEVRRRLVAGAHDTPEKKALGTEARPFPSEWIFAYDTVQGPHRTVADVARERGIDPAAALRVVSDPDTLGPGVAECAPARRAGARRLVQRARGVGAPVVGGGVLLRDGKHPGALPGRLLRGPLAR